VVAPVQQVENLGGDAPGFVDLIAAFPIQQNGIDRVIASWGNETNAPKTCELLLLPLSVSPL